MVESDFLARPQESRLTGKPSYEPGHDVGSAGATNDPPRPAAYPDAHGVKPGHDGWGWPCEPAESQSFGRLV